MQRGARYRTECPERPKGSFLFEPTCASVPDPQWNVKRGLGSFEKEVINEPEKIGFSRRWPEEDLCSSTRK